jgi:hypothetical protein
MVAGVIITTEMETTELAESSYEAISKAVGGYIQIVPPQNDFAGYSMYLHEEGKLIGLPFNDWATAVWEKAWGVGTDYILGDVVIVNSQTDGDGNELPISEEQKAEFLKNFANAVA